VTVVVQKYVVGGVDGVSSWSEMVVAET